jgi:BCD family chlorophyll transporter-like MFS transporter
MVAAPLQMPGLFLVGNFLIGFGGALFGHGTLTATMNLAPRKQAGLALGAWGAVQATAAGLGMALSGTIRDLVDAWQAGGAPADGDTVSANGYMTVYGIEILLLVVTVAVTLPLIKRAAARRRGAAEALNKPSAVAPDAAAETAATNR